jgi:hypothetical protein
MYDLLVQSFFANIYKYAPSWIHIIYPFTFDLA